MKDLAISLLMMSAVDGVSLLQVFFVTSICRNAHFTFDPANQVLCQLVSELDLLSEGQISTVLHQLQEK